MSDKIYEIPAEWTKRAFISEAEYKKMYASSLADPDGAYLRLRRIMDMKALTSMTTAPIHTRLMKGLVLTSMARMSSLFAASAPGRMSETRPPLLGSAVAIETAPPPGM